LRQNESLFSGKGNVTFSGGEPLMQHEFLLEVLEQIPDFSVAIETCGFAKPEVFQQVIQQMDLVYMDLKLADDTAHRTYTGVSNQIILENLEILRRSGINCVVRTPLIPKITDTDENLSAIRKLVGGLSWELIPYNDLAGAKYPMFEMEYPYEKLIKEI
jgi:pyruvate formate lyase activating enzyme